MAGLFELGFGVYSLAAIAVTGAVAALYLVEYQRRQAPAGRPREDDEPFDDPVEEALRSDVEDGSGDPSAVSPSIVPGPRDEPDDGLE